MATEIIAALGLGVITGVLVRFFLRSEKLEEYSSVLLEAVILVLILVAGIELGSRLATSHIGTCDLFYYSFLPGLSSMAVLLLVRRVSK